MGGRGCGEPGRWFKAEEVRSRVEDLRLERLRLEDYGFDLHRFYFS